MDVSALLDGRRALVTGAGTGIGGAIARALAQHGARVCATDIELDRAKATAAACGDGALALKLDVTDAAETDAVFDAAFAAFGQIDLVCANAGVSTMRAVVDLTEAEWDFNMDVNAKGVFLTDQAAVRRFLKHGIKGTIVNTASIAAKIAAPLLAHYSASKYAVAGFTQALAREVAKDGIRVNAVCPGYVRTSMQSREILWEAELRGMTPDAVKAEYIANTPLGRLEEPEDVAQAVVYLHSDLARFTTGQALNLGGGVFMA